ncbi:MAG: iron chelate uptake ABC transporter family permease subunit [Alphaproteobacteria bacterium]
MDDFVWRAIAAGAGVALAAGPLGCFVVWRRMAYFGDALAHSALLGVALGFLFGIDLTLGVVGSSAVLAVLIVWLQEQRSLATDTLLGILAHAMLALGMVAIGLMPNIRVDLLGYLFGDMLAVTPQDLYWVFGGGAIVLGALALLWRPLLAITVHEELARAEGVPTLRVRLIFMVLIALVIAIAMKIVGVLLIVSLLIIPAAAARSCVRTPEAMAALSALLGVVSVAGGLYGSLVLDAPAGPSVVTVATAIFVVCVAGSLLARSGAWQRADESR